MVFRSGFVLKDCGNPLTLGTLSTGEPLLFPPSLRDKHLYICGSTGTGKSKLLEHLIKQDINQWSRSGCGLLLIDPHGSLYNNVLKWCAWYGVEAPILPIDLRRKDWTVGYNMLRHRAGSDPGVIVEYFVRAMSHVWGESGTENTPRFGRWASNVIRTLYENELTLTEAEHITDRADIRSKQIRHALGKRVKDTSTVRDLALLNELNPFQVESELGSTINRFHTFLKVQAMRCMFGQRSVSLDLRRVLDEGWIVLVNLAPEGGNVTDENGSLFATLLLTDLWTTARERGKPDDARDVKPFYVYVDEFQNFVTPTIAKQLDEARGFGLNLTMSHQFPRQLMHQGAHGEQLLDSIMANARSKIAFQIGNADDLRRMAETLFMGTMSPDKIKHELYSTKVMGYREEWRVTEGGSESTFQSRGESTGSGRNRGESRSFMDGDETGETENASESDTSSESTSESHGRARTWNRVPMLIPEMGVELSSVQFEPLEEQLYRNMAVLFDQKQRHALARLAESKAPVAFATPEVKGIPRAPEIVEEYTIKLLKQSQCALPVSDALKHVEDRRRDFELHYLERATAEPTQWEHRTDDDGTIPKSPPKAALPTPKPPIVVEIKPEKRRMRRKPGSAKE